MPIPRRTTLLIPIFVFLLMSPRPPSVSADELSVVSHPSKLQLPLGQPVDSSPGARPGSIMTCNRVHIHGLSRLRHLNRFAHRLKVRVSVSQGDALFRVQNVELCFHRNASLGVGMCSAAEWQKLSGGSWVQSMSPYEYRILDIRMLPDPSRSIELSIGFEFLFHRLVFLVMGTVMMATARIVSQSVVFYYGSAMAVGIILVILMVLFQGMRLLPAGRKSSLAIFMYSSTVGVTTYLLHYLSGLLRSILVEIGISEDMHNPLGIFLLVCFVLAGAWFGYWGVRKLILTEDGLVDSSVAYFVEWAIMSFAAVMILQSSLDSLLAAEALGFAIIMYTLTRTHGKSKFLRFLIRRVVKSMSRPRDQDHTHAEYSRHMKKARSEPSRHRAKHVRLSPCNSPVLGPSPFQEESYYSIIHDAPDRKRRVSKEQWEAFTREQTRQALRELVSSPDFGLWAAANAERLTVTPPEGVRPKPRFRWF